VSGRERGAERGKGRMRTHVTAGEPANARKIGGGRWDAKTPSHIWSSVAVQALLSLMQDSSRPELPAPTLRSFLHADRVINIRWSHSCKGDRAARRWKGASNHGNAASCGPRKGAS